DDALLRSIGVERANHLAARIIEHGNFLSELGVARGDIVHANGKERLILFNDAALVVIDLPTADDYIRRTAGKRSPADGIRRSGRLIRRQDAAAKSRIAEQDLLGLCSRLQQSPESIGILDGFDGFIAFWQSDVRLRNVVLANDLAH